MNSIVFTGIPIPPSDNSLFPTHRDGVRRKSKDYIIWLREMDAWAWMNRAVIKEARELGKLKPLLRIEILLKCPASTFWTQKGTVKRFDLQNRSKAILDALSKIMELDDSHVWELKMQKIQNESNCLDLFLGTI